MSEATKKSRRARRLWHHDGPWSRTAYGAFLALAALSLPILLLAGIALFGGRYQGWRGGTEWDVWFLAAVYPVGIAFAGAFAGLVAPWIRRAWLAGVAGFFTALPPFVLLTLAIDPRGSTPYSPGPRELAVAFICALAVGMPTGIGVFRSGPKRWVQKKSRSTT
jgi:hypothetical protein